VSALNTVRRERKISPYECSNIYITHEDKQFLDKNEVPIQKVDAKSNLETQRGIKKVQTRSFDNQRTAYNMKADSMGRLQLKCDGTR